jgi:hypothetical protein
MVRRSDCFFRLIVWLESFEILQSNRSGLASRVTIWKRWVYDAEGLAVGVGHSFALQHLMGRKAPSPLIRLQFSCSTTANPASVIAKSWFFL